MKKRNYSPVEQDLATLHRTLAEKRSRLDVLRQLNEEGEGLAEGSQALLKGVDGPENSATRLRVRSLRNSMLTKIHSGNRTALGRNLHAVILKDANVVSK